MRFKELDELARKDETPDERTYHDRRRVEPRAALYAGIAIREAREESGLSQTELAARIGIAQSALSRIEAGRANLTLGTLQRVADAGERSRPIPRDRVGSQLQRRRSQASSSGARGRSFPADVLTNC